MMVRKKNNSVKWNTTGGIKLVLMFVIIFGAFVYYLNYCTESNDIEDEFIESNYSFVKARIVDKSTYKGWSHTVEYKVNIIQCKVSDDAKTKI